LELTDCVRSMGKCCVRKIAGAYVSARLETKLGIAFSVWAVLISALLTFTLYQNFCLQLREGIRQRLHDVTALAALAVDGDAHATLTRRDQEGSPAYMRIKRVLQECRDRATDIRFTYTWRRSPDGKIIFVVDAETDPNEMSHLGDVYSSGDPSLMARLATLDQVAVDEDFTTDKWGVWLSGYAPFYRSDGRMEGILGMDISASDVLAKEHRFLWIALGVFGATVPLALMLGLWFGRRLAAPMVRLTAGSEHIAQGDWSYRVRVQGCGETNTLARSFNHMAETLQKAIAHRDEEIENRRRAETALDSVNRDLQATVDQLSRANEELRSFTAITSHDLKTPLRSIRMLIDWIEADYREKLGADGREFLRLIVARVTRMYNFIEAVQQYTSIGYAKQDKTQVDVHSLVSHIIEKMAVPAHIELEIEGVLPVIACNPTHIRQVFERLLGNAVKYMDKPHGHVVVRCSEEPASWTFSVTDNGPGIDEKYHTKIFAMFQTLSTRDQLESTGIGLSIVRKIVALYDGQIWLESQLGMGSTFFFTLPKPIPTDAEQDSLLAASRPFSNPN
jgi:signal transduction histidine kinase